MKKIGLKQILINKGFFKFMSDEKFIKYNYKYRTGKKINLDNPKTFSEKIQWLKLYNRNDEYTKMVDKYEAKKYVANIIGEEYIIPTLGIYDKFDDINFEKLPNQFVLKCTHDSGGVIICKDKKDFDLKKVKKEINKRLKRNYFIKGREWAYKNVKPRIIIEKYMATENQKELKDYKFFCFNGEPKFLANCVGMSNHAKAKYSYINMNYELDNFHRKDYEPLVEITKPKNFEKMKEIAKILSKNIPFVRIDFYEIEGKIYFGEITFYPSSGYIPFEPEEYEYIIGDMIEIPQNKEN